MEEKIFCEKKSFGRPTAGIKSGSYAKIIGPQPGPWIYCRDTFHGQTQNLKEMLFCHKAGVSENIALFIYKFESILNHTNLTICGPTNINRIMWIKPAQFWIRQPIRRSLFTALLRAAQKYDPVTDNFEEALFSNQYLKSSQPAVRRFLRGYTWYTGNAGGWDNAFRSRSEKQIEEMLTLKPISDKKLIEFAAELLGTTIDDLKVKFRKTKYAKKLPVSATS
jgi:hypothetical protein